MAAKHTQLGKKGEDLAVDFLLRNGFTILERNFRYQKAEVDIIAKIDETLVAIEVKTRSTDEFGSPQDFVKPRQILRLVKAMDYYINENDLDLEVRFDIIAIIQKGKRVSIEHFVDAFYPF